MLVSSLVTLLIGCGLAIAPDMQFMIDPVCKPAKHLVRVAGLRLRPWHLMARTLVHPPLLCASHDAKRVNDPGSYFDAYLKGVLSRLPKQPDYRRNEYVITRQDNEDRRLELPRKRSRKR